MASQIGGYLATPRAQLASVMTGGARNDPFGFRTARNTFGFNSLNEPAPVPVVRPPRQPASAPVAPPAVSPAAAPTVDTTFSQPAGAGGRPLYSLDTDPALQQAYAYTGQADQAARAQATADKTRLVEQAGLSDLAAALGLGSSVAQVASANPFSTAANLKHDYQLAAQDLARQNTDQRHNFDEQANQQNLFFSGYRDRQLGKLADAFQQAQAENTRGYQGGLASLSSVVQGQVAQIGSALAQALAANEQQRNTERQAARDRQVQLALQTGYSFDGYDANGNPILTPIPTAPAATAGSAPAAEATNVGSGVAGASPNLVDALVSAAANDARKRGQRGEYLSLV